MSLTCCFLLLVLCCCCDVASCLRTNHAMKYMATSTRSSGSNGTERQRDKQRLRLRQTPWRLTHGATHTEILPFSDSHSHSHSHGHGQSHSYSQSYSHRISAAISGGGEGHKANETLSVSLSPSASPSTSHSLCPSLPCGDELDLQIARLALPAMLHYAVAPLVGVADTYWVGRLRDALALAGQGAANSVFNSAFWVLSFLPSVITPLIARASGAGDHDAVTDRVSEAIIIATVAGLLGTIVLGLFPDWAISVVLHSKAAAREHAVPYLRARALTFVPALLATVSFAVFRGSMDVVTPLKITTVANVVNILLDPIFIFQCALGATGAAAATCVGDLLAFSWYMKSLTNKGLLDLKKLLRWPSWKKFVPLLTSGVSMQLRAIALHTAIISIARKIHQLDATGRSAAAHSIALQIYLLGSVTSMALNMVSSVIIPVELAKAKKENTRVAMLRVRAIANRLIIWGTLLGLTLCLLQIGALPIIGWFSPLPDVQLLARAPTMIGALLQFLNALVFVGEGIQQGTQSFLPIAVATALGTSTMLVALKLFGNSVGTVWGCYVLLASMRLGGAALHHFFTGPLAMRKIDDLFPQLSDSQTKQ